jgi:hypothetical protein
MNHTEQHRQTWEAYTAAWQAPGAEAKALALRASVDAGCVYRDPLTHVEGHAALIDYMIDFHRQVPGGSFRTTSFRAHSARSVATWHMCDAAGTVIGEGISYGEYAPDGMLVAMNGFFDMPGQDGR